MAYVEFFTIAVVVFVFRLDVAEVHVISHPLYCTTRMQQNGLHMRHVKQRLCGTFCNNANYLLNRNREVGRINIT